MIDFLIHAAAIVGGLMLICGGALIVAAFVIRNDGRTR